MKKMYFAKALVMAVCAVLFFSCKSNGNNETPAEKPADTTAQEAPAVNPLDSVDALALFSGIFNNMPEDQFHAKELFSDDFYTVCQKLCEQSDGDALWVLGSSERLFKAEVLEAEFTSPEEASVLLGLDVGDYDESEPKGYEERRAKMVLKDGKWLIDDVNNYKEAYRKTIGEGK